LTELAVPFLKFAEGVRTHRALLAAGSPRELHVLEELWHCFRYHHRMAESQDAYRTIASFFDRNLVAGPALVRRGAC